ncbi:MAG TPA: hypothetical protein VMI94_08245 [Bryobacteraceae bacterium]|nr:hypothetical protein [Bryobacteraceae bacterium]
MNNFRAVSLCLLVLGLRMSGQQQAPVQEYLTDAKVIQMVQSHLSPDLIILAISKCSPHFALDPASTQYMLQQGVTEEIFKAMGARQNGNPIPGYTQTAATTTPVDPPASHVAIPINSKDRYESKLGTVNLSIGGGVFIDKDMVPAAHPAVMTNTSIALHKYLAGYGEFGYTHLASGSGNVYGYDVSANAYLLDYGAGAKFTIPTGTRVVPYGTFGFGRSHLGVSASAIGMDVGAGEAAWNVNFGGGVNVFATKNVGFNFDFRAYRPSKEGYSTWYERAAFGVFFQFNGAGL